MEPVVHEDKTFDKADFSEKPMPRSEFADCLFNNCNFLKAIIGNSDFIDCTFNNCNFSLAVMENTGLTNAMFSGCKMVGIDFSKCSDFLFSVSFVNCPLDYCSFYRKKMKKTVFRDCSIKDADFTETDLGMAVFAHCDLLNTVFIGSMLEKTDFRTARNYAFDPALNNIKKAKFSLAGVTGLLVKYDIEVE